MLKLSHKMSESQRTKPGNLEFTFVDIRIFDTVIVNPFFQTDDVYFQVLLIDFGGEQAPTIGS